MTQEPHPSGDDPQGTDAPADPPIAVAVRRTGGFAGLTKQWRAEPPPDEASGWVALITQCPWDAVPAGAGAGGADRFTWWIQARCGDQDEREAEVPDDELVGAWRELVDAVRDWSRSDGGAEGGAAGGRRQRA